MELNKVLSMVRKLVERAEHPETDQAEAKACRERADALMLKYAIEEATLNAARPAAQRTKPGTIIISGWPMGSPFEQELSHLAGIVAHYTRVKFVMFGYGIKMSKAMRDYYKKNPKARPGSVRLKVYGFESDLRYFEFMWTTLHLHLANGLEMEYTFDRPHDQMCYDMHTAGYNWLDMARSYGWRAMTRREAEEYPDVKVPWVHEQGVSRDGIEPWTVIPLTSVGPPFKSGYYRYIKTLGEDRVIIPASSKIVYQNNFIHAYWVRVAQRLREAEGHRQKGGELVLASAFELVMKLYEDDNPKMKEAKEHNIKFNADGWKRGTGHANTADLGGGKVGSPDRKAVK
jgi:hypothetical protein